MIIHQKESYDVVSARLYAQILTSPRLKDMLLPEGILRSPYEILDYRLRLTLHDREGMRATFRRSQTIRFLQAGVSGILDHAWGSGIVMTTYYNDAGCLADSFRDEGRRHMVVRLKRAMGPGEMLTFHVERTTMASFVAEDQWWMETTIDHPIRNLSVEVVFPRTRAPLYALLDHSGDERSMPVHWRADGRYQVRFDLGAADAHAPYFIRWAW